MALEAAFQFLYDQLRLLKEAVDELQLNVSGDYYPESRSRKQPDGDSARDQTPLPLEWLADKTAELEGAVEEAQHAAAVGVKAVRYPQNLMETQIALIAIQRCLNGALKTFYNEVAAYDTIQTLIQMGSRKGGKWPEWITLVKTVIEACRGPLHEAFQALGECWQELAEKIGTNFVSVQATNIGQQIRMRQNPEAAVHD
jgi:hypothetical protein